MSGNNTAPKAKNDKKYEEDKINKTYPGYINTHECSCGGGALMKPAPIPTGTKNAADSLVNLIQTLTSFVASYSLITVIMKFIGCMVEVLCAATNPWSMVKAMSRLFGTCLPDLIALFPPIAIPSIIICIVKIINSIVNYILKSIIPLIAEILANIQMLKNAVSTNNRDAQLAIAFKIVSIFTELQSILGIFAAIVSLMNMIKSLLGLAMSVPCGGGGGSCDECGGEEACPEFLQNTIYTGSDGQISNKVYFNFSTFKAEQYIAFYSEQLKDGLVQIQNFFPNGIDYQKITKEEFIPYELVINNSKCFLTSVNSNGEASAVITSLSILNDSYSGYLYDTDMNGNKYPQVPFAPFARLSIDIDFFQESFKGRDIIINDQRQEYAENNNGKYEIVDFYNNKNILIKRDDGSWNYSTEEKNIKFGIDLTNGTDLQFTLTINHDALVYYQLINLGCHPVVKNAKEGLKNRYKQLSSELPSNLPDINELNQNLANCLSNVIPLNVDMNYILNNYLNIEEKLPQLQNCVNNLLNNFANDMNDYNKTILPNSVDYENSIFTVNHDIQIIGKDILVTVIPVDMNKNYILSGLPQNSLKVEINASAGNLTNVVEQTDGYGISLGIFNATLTSNAVQNINITAKINNTDISEFNGIDLQPIVLNVNFVEVGKQINEDINEPLGK